MGGEPMRSLDASDATLRRADDMHADESIVYTLHHLEVGGTTRSE